MNLRVYLHGTLIAYLCFNAACAIATYIIYFKTLHPPVEYIPPLKTYPEIFYVLQPVGYMRPIITGPEALHILSILSFFFFSVVNIILSIILFVNKKYTYAFFAVFPFFPVISLGLFFPRFRAAVLPRLLPFRHVTKRRLVKGAAVCTIIGIFIVGGIYIASTGASHYGIDTSKPVERSLAQEKEKEPYWMAKPIVVPHEPETKLEPLEPQQPIEPETKLEPLEPQQPTQQPPYQSQSLTSSSEDNSPAGSIRYEFTSDAHHYHGHVNGAWSFFSKPNLNTKNVVAYIIPLKSKEIVTGFSGPIWTDKGLRKFILMGNLNYAKPLATEHDIRQFFHSLNDAESEESRAKTRKVFDGIKIDIITNAIKADGTGEIIANLEFPPGWPSEGDAARGSLLLRRRAEQPLLVIGALNALPINNGENPIPLVYPSVSPDTAGLFSQEARDGTAGAAPTPTQHPPP